MTRTQAETDADMQHAHEPEPARRKHQWAASTLGHGEAQCTHCLMTNREAWVLGEFCIDV